MIDLKKGYTKEERCGCVLYRGQDTWDVNDYARANRPSVSAGVRLAQEEEGITQKSSRQSAEQSVSQYQERPQFHASDRNE